MVYKHVLLNRQFKHENYLQNLKKSLYFFTDKNDKGLFFCIKKTDKAYPVRFQKDLKCFI